MKEEGGKMFSQDEKVMIAKKVEELLLNLNHPEMPNKKPMFHLHVNGSEEWSWADIEPNWKFDDKKPSINPWNEVAREKMGEKS